MNTGNSQSNHLVPSFQNWRRWLIGLLGFIVASLVFCWWEARLPDETLTFEREVPSKLELAQLASKLENVSEWNTWFHNVVEAQILDSENHPLPKAEQKARAGANVELQIDPGKGSHRRFQIAGRITRYEPGKLLEIQVLDDSKGKITRILDHLIWRVELSPDPANKQVRILGTEIAHTTHWRSRLFGRISPRVLLNQLYYPNLQVLANPETPPKADGLF